MIIALTPPKKLNAKEHGDVVFGMPLAETWLARYGLV
jgi:hypothetical protein